ncbi:Uncharacterised protein [Vibrio cholerae]|nr:Uncharacterised protein [Vibrio cholerae]
MAIWVTCGFDNRRMTKLGNRQEVVRGTSRANRIRRDFNVAIGTVFETYRARQPRSQFTMHL